MVLKILIASSLIQAISLFLINVAFLSCSDLNLNFKRALSTKRSNLILMRFTMKSIYICALLIPKCAQPRFLSHDRTRYYSLINILRVRWERTRSAEIGGSFSVFLAFFQSLVKARLCSLFKYRVHKSRTFRELENKLFAYITMPNSCRILVLSKLQSLNLNYDDQSTDAKNLSKRQAC